MKRYLLLAFLASAVLLGACAKESSLPKATGKGTLRAINTIPASPSIAFLIEERLIGTANYKTTSTAAQFDDLNYTFNFEVVLAGDTAQTRVASQAFDVEADMDYTFLIAGVIAAPVISVWEEIERVWDGSETVFEARFGHTAASLGDIDVYFAAAGIAPVLGAELGTLSFGGIVPAAEYQSGEFVLTITAAGDPTMVLFESDPITPVAQTALIISVFDSDENDLGPLAVRVINLSSGGVGALVDVNVDPSVRFFHASMNAGNTDIYIDDPLTVPFIANHAFGDVTGDLDSQTGVLPLTYTVAGNMGSVLIDVDPTIISGTHNHYYLIENSTGDDVLITQLPDRRSIDTFARLGLMNTAVTNDIVDIYTVLRGESIDEALPTTALSLGAASFNLPIAAASYDIYITVVSEKTVLAGPIPLDAGLGDVFDLIIYENVDPNIVDVVFIPIP